MLLISVDYSAILSVIPCRSMQVDFPDTTSAAPPNKNHTEAQQSYELRFHFFFRNQSGSDSRWVSCCYQFLALSGILGAVRATPLE
jgi:hypothetical protein